MGGPGGDCGINESLSKVEDAVRSFSKESSILSEKMIKLSNAMIWLTVAIFVLTGLLVCEQFSLFGV